MKTTYTSTFKTQVVLELLKEEKTISQLAAEYKVHPAAFACILEKDMVARRYDQCCIYTRRKDREQVKRQAAGTGWPGGF